MALISKFAFFFLVSSVFAGDEKVCGGISKCVLLNIGSNTTSPVGKYSPDTEDHPDYTIVCEADTSDGKQVDYLRFLYDGRVRKEYKAPYAMNGNRGRHYNRVKYLKNCGPKEVTVEAYTRNNKGSDDYLCDTKTYQFEACPSSFFDITLELLGDAPNYQEEFHAAASKWESIIRQSKDNGVFGPLPPLDYGCGPLPEFIDDILICGDFLPIDGPLGILGFAGPSSFYDDENGVVKTLAGIMVFDTEDIDFLESLNILSPVLEHEMGHVLGLGSLWDVNGLTDRSNYNFFEGCPYLSDSNASREWGRLSGCRGQSVWVEDSTRRPGTDCGHWDEMCMPTELMTGFLNLEETNLLSTITVGSFEDLGYEVDYSAADPYTRDDISPHCRCDLGKRTDVCHPETRTVQSLTLIPLPCIHRSPSR